MITQFKIYESEIHSDDEIKFLSSTVKCNYCDWYGTDNDLIEIDEIEHNDEYITQSCPICEVDDYLMDLSDSETVTNDKDFNMYITHTKPKIGVNFKDFNSPIDYAKVAYPEFFMSKKYNL